MKYAITCQHCNSKKVAYSHKLNRALVSALKQMVDYYETHHARANVDKDLHLTYNQASNFQKLRYWGVVHRDKSGWVPTIKGSQFIRGEIKIPDTAGSLEGEPIEYSHPAWQTHTKEIQRVGIYNFLPQEYKQREEYQAETPEPLTLFSVIPGSRV